MLILEIACANYRYMDESAALSQLLLPFNNYITDYSIIKKDTFFIMGKFWDHLSFTTETVMDPSVLAS